MMMSITWHEDGDDFFVKMTREEFNQYMNERNETSNKYGYQAAVNDAIIVATKLYEPTTTKWGEFTCVSHPMVDLDQIVSELSKLKQKL